MAKKWYNALLKKISNNHDSSGVSGSLKNWKHHQTSELFYYTLDIYEQGLQQTKLK